MTLALTPSLAYALNGGSGLSASRQPAGLTHIDAAREEGTIHNADALCNHIPGQGTFRRMSTRSDGAAHLAQNHHLTDRDIRRHLCTEANCDPAVR